MVIIQDNIGVKQVEIPCNLVKNRSNYEIAFRHTTNKKTFTFNVIDHDPDNRLFYKFQIDFTGMPKGEYEYCVGKETGLFRIGDEIEIKNYSQKITYKSYDANR